MDAALFIAQFHINRRLKNIQKLYILFAIYYIYLPFVYMGFNPIFILYNYQNDKNNDN